MREPAPARRTAARAAAGCRSGASTSHSKAMAHQTQAMASRISRCAGSLVHCQLNRNSSAMHRRRSARRAERTCRAPKPAHSQAPMVPPRRTRARCPARRQHEQAHRQQAAQDHPGRDPQLKHRLWPRAARRSCRSAARAGRRTAKRRIEMRRREFGPQHLGEVHFGVGEIPQQEVADALFAAGADQKVRVGNAGEREPRADLRFIDIGCRQPAGGHLARRASGTPERCPSGRRRPSPRSRPSPVFASVSEVRIRHALRQLAAQQRPDRR